MILEEMYLSDDTAEILFHKLKKYNDKHSGETITAQELAEKLLTYAIDYLNIDIITLD